MDSFKHVQFIIHGIHSPLKALQNLYFIFGSCLLSYLIRQKSRHGSSNLKMVKLHVLRWSKSYEDKLSTWLLRSLRYCYGRSQAGKRYNWLGQLRQSSNLNKEVKIPMIGSLQKLTNIMALSDPSSMQENIPSKCLFLSAPVMFS